MPIIEDPTHQLETEHEQRTSISQPRILLLPNPAREVWVADLPAGAYKFIAFMKDGTQFTQTISVVN